MNKRVLAVVVMIGISCLLILPVKAEPGDAEAQIRAAFEDRVTDDARLDRLWLQLGINGRFRRGDFADWDGKFTCRLSGCQLHETGIRELDLSASAWLGR